MKINTHPVTLIGMNNAFIEYIKRRKLSEFYHPVYKDKWQHIHKEKASALEIEFPRFKEEYEMLYER